MIPLPLWPTPRTPANPDGRSEAPAAGRINIGDNPTITPYLLPGEDAKPLVVIFPGGGYAMQAAHEGEPIARMLNQQGFHAAVVHYRVGPRHRHPAMIHDAQRAVRLVRQHAWPWHVRPYRIGALGFSAGGHLTATLGVHYDKFTCPDDDLADKYSARPDALVLCYAVIDLMTLTHKGSRENLLGHKPDPALVELLSLQKQITAQTPPTFLWHTATDGAVPVQNSILYALACREKGVPAELHVYESGGHGMGLAEPHPSISTWPRLCGLFLVRHLMNGRREGQSPTSKVQGPKSEA
jgi:acetyl esterase/lipase